METQLSSRRRVRSIHVKACMRPSYIFRDHRARQRPQAGLALDLISIEAFKVAAGASGKAVPWLFGGGLGISSFSLRS